MRSRGRVCDQLEKLSFDWGTIAEREDVGRLSGEVGARRVMVGGGEGVRARITAAMCAEGTSAWSSGAVKEGCGGGEGWRGGGLGWSSSCSGVTVGSTMGRESVRGRGERRAGWICSRPGRLLVGEGSLVGGFVVLVLGLGVVAFGETERERSPLAGMGGSGRLTGGRDCSESLEMLDTRLGMWFRAGMPVGTSGKACSWRSVRSSYDAWMVISCDL